MAITEIHKGSYKELLYMMWKDSKIPRTFKNQPVQYVEDYGGSASLLFFAGWETWLVRGGYL